MTTTYIPRSWIKYYKQGKPVYFRGRGLEATALQDEDSVEPTFNFRKPKRKMSYRRRRRHFKRPYGRKYYGRRPNAGRIALRKVNKMMREQEVKIHSAQNGSLQIPIAGAGQIETFGPFFVRGTNVNNRMGDIMTLKTFSLESSCIFVICVVADQRIVNQHICHSWICPLWIPVIPNDQSHLTPCGFNSR